MTLRVWNQNDVMHFPGRAAQQRTSVYLFAHTSRDYKSKFQSREIPKQKTNTYRWSERIYRDYFFLTSRSIAALKHSVRVIFPSMSPSLFYFYIKREPGLFATCRYGFDRRTSREFHQASTSDIYKSTSNREDGLLQPFEKKKKYSSEEFAS